MSESITLCPSCNCMTKTVDGKCGKCGSLKSSNSRSLKQNEKWAYELILKLQTFLKDNNFEVILTEVEKMIAKSEDAILDKIKTMLPEAIDVKRYWNKEKTYQSGIERIYIHKILENLKSKK